MSDAQHAIAVVDAKQIPETFVGKLEPNYYCRAWNAKRAKYCRSRAGWGTDHQGMGRCRIHDGGGSDKLQHGLHRRYVRLEGTSLGEHFAAHLADTDPYNVLHDLAIARTLMEDWVVRYQEYTAALVAWHDTWEGKYTPLGPENKKALLDVLDEYEANLRELEPTELQEQQLARARAAVDFLATPQTAKPRQVLDVSDAIRHADVLSKIIHRVEQARSANAVSRPELLRIMSEMGRVVQAHVADPVTLQRISDGWLAIRL